MFNRRSKIHRIFGVLIAQSLYFSVELVRNSERSEFWHASCHRIARKRAKFKSRGASHAKKQKLTGKLPVAKKPELAAAPAKNNGTITKKLSAALGRHNI